MKIEKAIELLEQDLKDQFDNPVFGLNVAKSMGIEVLKYQKASRPTGLHSGMYRLPGETEE